MKFKGTKNWRIRYADPNDEGSFFFIEADLEKEGFYPRIEVLQEDYGDHNGYALANDLEIEFEIEEL